MFLCLTQTLVVFFDVHIKLSQQSGYNGVHLVRFACVGLSNMVVISLSLSLFPEKKLHQEDQLLDHSRHHFVDQAAYGYYRIEDDHIPFLNKGNINTVSILYCNDTQWLDVLFMTHQFFYPLVIISA